MAQAPSSGSGKGLFVSESCRLFGTICDAVTDPSQASYLQEITERGLQTLPDLLPGPGEAERPRVLLNQAFEVDRSAAINNVLKRLVEMVLGDILDRSENRTDGIMRDLEPRCQVREILVSSRFNVAGTNGLIAHMIGGSYERHKDHFNAQHGKDARTWPRELQLYRHLRNGCFHGNAFSIWPNKIDPANAPNWCGYEIPSENAVNGKKVVGDNAFFPITHLLPLFDDMAKYTE